MNLASLHNAGGQYPFWKFMVYNVPTKKWANWTGNFYNLVKAVEHYSSHWEGYWIRLVVFEKPGAKPEIIKNYPKKRKVK